MENKNIGTTTQTGPDGLVSYPKEEAKTVLQSLWGMNPRWVPRRVGHFRYPYIEDNDFSDIHIVKKDEFYTHLLKVQREKGFLSYADIEEHPEIKEKVVEIVGSDYNSSIEDRYVLDPINDTLLRLPNTEKGKSLYKQIYASRFHYIESIPEAFSFLGRKGIEGDLNATANDSIEKTIVFVCGLGTGGGETAIRLGKQFPFINLALIDGGIFGPENIDRQVATPSNIGLNKSIAVAGKIFEINPMIKNLYCIPSYITKENVDGLLNSTISEMGISDPVIQIIDEIDVTETETLLAKAELHYAAIRLAQKMRRPVYVHWSLDLGASGEVVGTCCYKGDEKEIFNGRYSKREAQLPAVLAMYGMIPLKSIGLEMISDIKSRLKKDSRLEHISQSGLSAIGVAKVISTRVMLTMFGYGHCIKNRTFHDDLRSSFKMLPRLSAAIHRMPYTATLKIWGYIKKREALKIIE